MGIVFSGMFAVGLIIYISVKSEVHLDHILFGDMLGISPADIWQSGAIAGVIAMIIGIKWRDLVLHAFDAQQAKACGLNTALLHYGLLSMIALTIVATLKAVGIVLSIALLIAPGAIAILLMRRFSSVMICSVLLSVVVCFSGTYLSFFLDSAPGPTIVLLFAVLFIAAFIFSARRDHYAITAR